jgi:DNA-binding transcriptional regulator PaaX
MSSRKDYSNKIIRVLGEKSAISLPELSEQVSDQNEEKSPNYAITRSLKGLREAGLVEHLSSGQNEYARLTKEGRKKMYSLKLQNEHTLVSTVWDGFWRMIILDLPEERKNERESLRYLLKKAGFICLKNSVWVSPHPFEHLFINIKKDLGLTTEMIILVTNKLDEETENLLFQNFMK